jgi:hypothetical protein
MVVYVLVKTRSLCVTSFFLWEGNDGVGSFA